MSSTILFLRCLLNSPFSCSALQYYPQILPSMTPHTPVHQSAQEGFRDAASYDLHRPSYPTQAVDALLKHLGIYGKPHARVVDLAAGTGKFTSVLRDRAAEGVEIVAIEPLASMRATLAAKRLANVTVKDGRAEHLDVVDGWADAVITAQAFHWFANEAALKEIHRVLKPGGKLAMIWNAEDYNKPAAIPAKTEWGQVLNDLVLSLPTDGQARFRDDAWREVFDRQAQSSEPLFSTPISEEMSPFAVSLTVEELWDRMRTLSQIALLTSEDQREFRGKFESIVRDVERDGDGKMQIHGFCLAVWTQALPVFPAHILVSKNTAEQTAPSGEP